VRPMKKLLLALSLASIALAGCKKNPPLTPPPPPLRPEPLPPPPPPTAAKTDCDPSNPSDSLAAVEYKVRQPRIDEAQKQADLAVADLQAAEGTELAPEMREKFITDAVDGLLRALNADPYNVHATYNLAAAYARIKRTQCSLNMLERLLLMKDHHSRKVEVNKKLDRLLGRNATRLDPDFNDVRQDKRFACLISNMGAAQPVPCW
jgi:tetratricopeptide (TPR) repeat protein